MANSMDSPFVNNNKNFSHFGRSLSVNSESSSSSYSSSSYSPPPFSSIDKFSTSKAMNIPFGGGGRLRTSSFSGGYDRYQKQEQKDSKFDTFDDFLSNSAPGGSFRRSNSISVGAMDHSYGNHLSSPFSTSPRNLGPIDEIGRMYDHFGDAFKKSMGQLFNAPKISPASSTSNYGSKYNNKNSYELNQKKKTRMTDQVVSMLCEGAVR